MIDPGEAEEARLRQIELDRRVIVARDRFLAATAMAARWSAALELEKVNQALREHGISHPLGAAGVQDVFAQMGDVQLFDEEVPVVLALMETALKSMSPCPHRETAEHVIGKLRRAAGQPAGTAT